MQPPTDRRFSREQHLSGRWRTAALSRRHPVFRWFLKCISLKHQELDRLARRCLPEFLVVDLGAGIGSYAHFFLRRCPATIIAVDWSPEALGEIPPPAGGRLLKVCADAHYLPIKPSRIDALYTIDTLGHLRRQEQALDEINRICRGGAPLFLHSECSDYRSRWPDRVLIGKCGVDHIAEIDGHFGIRPSTGMRALYDRRFSLFRYFSPAGILGWLTGYPEKYLAVFLRCRLFLPALPVFMMVVIRKVPGCRFLMRLINAWSNRLELFVGLEGGGSCFAQGRTVIAEPFAGGSSVPSIDVVIPTYNRPGLPGPLVNSLVNQCRGSDRLFIVWQGTRRPDLQSGDQRIIMLHRAKPNLPAARNAAVSAGGNPIVLFIDDDCLARPGLLDGHRDAYRDLGVGAAAGFVDDPLFPPDAQAPSRFDPATGELVQHFALPESGTSLSVMGANMSFRRSALERIGGFDPNYRRNALWEEIDASFRIQKAGFTIAYRSAARVNHLRCGNGGCRSGTTAGYLFHQFANTAYFACSYAPLRHTRSWLTFWKYRLEFLSRRPFEGQSGRKHRHSPLLAAAGISGSVAGALRFMIYGRRIGLPDPVAAIERQTAGSG